ncbi:MAG: hypothetical protein AW08_03092 [Candidatus Accumulibacter adjunctus]|uniref:DUF3261 domain-containing protein n=1 Tax=Candidatus Accumulibacter adjunctus TaxID=1454001 RepID=A0A011NLR4_9PROT|nr:MAG: hypothetical protein AW08_03092 [Candidatus Accumulibacter adjunctus]
MIPSRAAASALCAAVLAIACAPSSEACIRLPGNGRYCLLAGSWPEYVTEQASTVTLKDKTLRMISRISSGHSGVHFAGLSPLGQTLFQVSWKDSVLHVEPPTVFENRLDPALIPALLQIATWPAELVREGLSGGVELLEQPGRRIIRGNNGDILIVSWEGNELPYQRLGFEAPTLNLAIDSRLLEALQ